MDAVLQSKEIVWNHFLDIRQAIWGHNRTFPNGEIINEQIPEVKERQRQIQRQRERQRDRERERTR